MVLCNYDGLILLKYRYNQTPDSAPPSLAAFECLRTEIPSRAVIRHTAINVREQWRYIGVWLYYNSTSFCVSLVQEHRFMGLN